MPLTSRLAGSAVAALLALGPQAGLAQTPSQGPKAKQPAPRAQQAPAQQTPTQQAPAQNAGPVIVELKPEPLQPEWTKVCGKDQGAKAEACYTTRDFVTDKGQRIVAVALYDTKAKGAQKTMRILMPLGFLVAPGIRVVAEKVQPVAGRYATCLPHGCFAEATVKDDFIAALKKGSTLNVSARNQAGKEVTFAVPTEGFGKAFDGPAIDPQVLAEQQKKVQEALQRRADDARNRQTGGSGSPAQAPAADAEAAAPKN